MTTWPTLALIILILTAVCFTARIDGKAQDLGHAGADSHPVARLSVSVPDRLELRKTAGNAAGGSVLDVGRPGQFDHHWVTCPTVVYDGQLFHMWYSSFYDSKMGRGGIGLATSCDGTDWQRACGGRPVLSVGGDGAWDDGQVMGPEVLFDGKQYRMWYTGMAKDWHESGVGFYRIFLATSRDGVRWHRENEGRPVLDVGPGGSADAVQVATPSIVKDAGGYRMWYAAWSPESNHRICTARSADGVTWRRENKGQPVAGLAPPLAYGPAVCKLGDQYLMLYMAAPAKRTLYAATSRDGTQWRMLGGGQPVLPLGAGSDFDSDQVGHPDLLVMHDRLSVWYTGYRREPAGTHGWKLRIGRCDVSLICGPAQHERSSRRQRTPLTQCRSMKHRELVILREPQRPKDLAVRSSLEVHNERHYP